jgi:hypothetical protein
LRKSKILTLIRIKITFVVEFYDDKTANIKSKSSCLTQTQLINNKFRIVKEFDCDASLERKILNKESHKVQLLNGSFQQKNYEKHNFY